MSAATNCSGSEDIKSITDLKGRKVGVGYNLTSDPHIFVSCHGDLCRPRSATRHRMDRRRDNSRRSFSSTARSMRSWLSAGGSGPARPQGRPRHPRQREGSAMVAILLLHAGGQHRPMRRRSGCHQARRCVPSSKSADICAAEPERVARLLVDGGHTEHYDYAVQSLRELPYSNWRDFDPEDTIRFFSLRLHEAGMVKSRPERNHRRTAPIGGSSTRSSAR